MEHPDADITWIEDPLYGPVPYRGLNSDRCGYDLDFEPALPPGALRGNPHLQRDFCPHCGPPRYFYVDQELLCAQCGDRFTWPATQQRQWYEELGFSVAAGPPTRCGPCRRARQLRRTLNTALQQAMAAADAHPDDVTALLDLAAVAAECAILLGWSTTDRGIGAARRARRQDPQACAAHFWEGRCHEAAGRPGRAVTSYDVFLREAPHARGFSDLRAQAEDRLATLRPPGGVG